MRFTFELLRDPGSRLLILISRSLSSAKHACCCERARFDSAAVVYIRANHRLDAGPCATLRCPPADSWPRLNRRPLCQCLSLCYWSSSSQEYERWSGVRVEVNASCPRSRCCLARPKLRDLTRGELCEGKTLAALSERSTKPSECYHRGVRSRKELLGQESLNGANSLLISRPRTK